MNSISTTDTVIISRTEINAELAKAGIRREYWQIVLREGVAPQMPTWVLAELADALEKKDARLVQGTTVLPPPLRGCGDFPAERVCVIGYCGLMQGKGTVEEIEEFFGDTCIASDNLLGESSFTRHLMNYFDDTDDTICFPAIAAELREIVRERGGVLID